MDSQDALTRTTVEQGGAIAGALYGLRPCTRAVATGGSQLGSALACVGGVVGGGVAGEETAKKLLGPLTFERKPWDHPECGGSWDVMGLMCEQPPGALTPLERFLRRPPS